MSALAFNKSIYQPVGRDVLFDGQKYCIFDIQLSTERANFYLNEAKNMLAQKSSDHAMDEAINERLLIATDFGSAEAPYLLAMRILEDKAAEHHDGVDAVILLGIAAERSHKNACAILAACYANEQTMSSLLEKANEYFAKIAPEERKILAEYYSTAAY